MDNQKSTTSGEPEATGKRLATGRRTRVVLHPFLFAAFPVLFLFAENREEAVVLHDLVNPLALAVAVAVFLVAMGWLIFRNARAVGLVVSAWALLFFSYGRAAQALGDVKIAGVEVGRDAYLLSAWSIAAAAVVLLARYLRTRLSAITTILNVVGMVLVGINAVSILVFGPGAAGPTARAAPPTLATPSAAALPKHLPDIYYIVPEDYGHPLSQRRWFGIDTNWFERYLRRKGFYVAARSMSNYQNTHQSLASSLNLQYLDTLLGSRPTHHENLRKLQNFEAARYLKALGYRYVHIGSWYGPTKTDPLADVDINSRSFSEFSDTLYQTTVLPAIFRSFHLAPDELDPRRAKWKRTLAEFDLVTRVRHLRGPKFVFSHIMFPHYQGPGERSHTIDRNGNFITEEQERGRSYRRLYADQIIYAAKRLEQVIDRLLSDPNYRPIIVLQTDEGVYPTRELEDNPALFKWNQVSKTDLRDHFLILNAYYVPGMSHRRLYPSITPVNSFRLIFDHYFHAGLRLLPDNYFARAVDPYRFVNITKIIRAQLRTLPATP